MITMMMMTTVMITIFLLLVMMIIIVDVFVFFITYVLQSLSNLEIPVSPFGKNGFAIYTVP